LTGYRAASPARAILDGRISRTLRGGAFIEKNYTSPADWVTHKGFPNSADTMTFAMRPLPE
jgi:hypothetical protein